MNQQIALTQHREGAHTQSSPRKGINRLAINKQELQILKNDKRGCSFI